MVVRQPARYTVPKCCMKHWSFPKEWQGFVEAVNRTYLAFDADRNMLERSLQLSSHELLQPNSEMRAVFQAFPDIFFRLHKEGTILEYKTGSTTVGRLDQPDH